MRHLLVRVLRWLLRRLETPVSHDLDVPPDVRTVRVYADGKGNVRWESSDD